MGCPQMGRLHFGARGRSPFLEVGFSDPARRTCTAISSSFHAPLAAGAVSLPVLVCPLAQDHPRADAKCPPPSTFPSVWPSPGAKKYLLSEYMCD